MFGSCVCRNNALNALNFLSQNGFDPGISLDGLPDAFKGCPVVIWLSHVDCSLQRRHLLSVDRQVGQLRYRQDVFGRIGMRFLKERQYQSPSARSSLDEHDVQALKFLSFVISVAPPRAVYFGRSSCLPCRICSDASQHRGSVHPPWMGVF